MRVAITTLGCKVNQYDTAVIERRFDERGWSRVGFDDTADAYVVNSCTVTDRADADARRLARRARRKNPDARVVMTGCYAQTSPDEVSALGEVDYVVGLGRLDDLLSAVEGELEQRAVVSDLRHAEEVATLGISTFSGRSRAFVKVQEGCNLFCTYCIVPVARGRSRSVSPRTVIDEIERLAARGYREVVLTGVHLGGYGDDLTPAMDLAGLLECIAERRPPLRVRISSIDPPEITERLLDVVSDGSLFCPHFHVPLQAGDDDILERMGRQYTAEEAARALGRLRERIPEVCIGTDMITGFPAETEEQFARSLRYLEDLEMSYLHVFPYSVRRATSAAKRWEPLEDSLVHERAREMRRLDGRLRQAYQDPFIGRSVRVLFEGAGTEGRLTGYSENYLPISCSADAEQSERLSNRVVPVEVVGRAGKRLEARLP